MFEFCDGNPNVLKWGGEVSVVEYFDPTKNTVRRYYVDLYIKYRNKAGQIIEEIVEVKPFAQTQPPKASRGKKRTTVVQELTTYQTNIAKWSAAAQYAKERGWRFRIITEHDIF